MAVLLKKRQTIAAKVETTIGTPETLNAATGVFNAYDISIQGDITVEQREGQGGFDMLAGVAGTRKGTMTFKTDVEWDGTSTDPVWASTLLAGCGFVGSSNVYTPRSEGPGSNVKTLTIGVYEDGVYKVLAGAMGNFKLFMPSGKKCYIEWTFDGAWQAVTDAALITPTYPTDTIVRFAGATVTYDSIDLCVAQMTLDAGNTVVMRECPDEDSGFKSAIVTERYPVIEADPEATLVATDDPYGSWLSGDEAALAVTLSGPTTSTIGITVPKAQIFNVQEGDRDKIMIDNITWRCNKNGTTQDQCVSITFTAAV